MSLRHFESNLRLDGCSLSIASVTAHLANPDSQISLSNKSRQSVTASSEVITRMLARKGKTYGVNTNFGALSRYSVRRGSIRQLQRNLVLSHAIGVKEALSVETCRLIFLLRINCLARGASGVRPELLDLMLDLYNRQAVPEIYRAGSLGASGDLGPLAHLAAFVIGEGWGYLRGQRMRASQIYEALKLKIPTLARKEGLSLINGTSAMTAVGILAIMSIRQNLDAMLGALALGLDCFRIPLSFLDRKALQLKPHPGAMNIAAAIHGLAAHKNRLQTRVLGDHQPIYSLRCAPLILGPLVESISACTRVLETEANSANDNPLYIKRRAHIYHGGHFHGAPVSIALDQLRIAAVHMSGIVDRQLEFFFDTRRNPHAFPFLSVDPSAGHCGFEGAQYLITSLHAECKMLANPFSPLTSPTNGGNQDYVSMGMQSALATAEMATNQRLVVATYALAIAQSYTLLRRTPSTTALKRLLAILTQANEFPYRDEILMKDVIERFSRGDSFAAFARIGGTHLER